MSLAGVDGGGRPAAALGQKPSDAPVGCKPPKDPRRRLSMLEERLFVAREDLFDPSREWGRARNGANCGAAYRSVRLPERGSGHSRTSGIFRREDDGCAS